MNVIKKIEKVTQNKNKVSSMCWCSHLSESAISEADLADSPDGYCNHRGEGNSPAQRVGPVWVHIAPAGCQGLVVQKVADEARLEGKAEDKLVLLWTNRH